MMQDRGGTRRVQVSVGEKIGVGQQRKDCLPAGRLMPQGTGRQRSFLVALIFSEKISQREGQCGQRVRVGEEKL